MQDVSGCEVSESSKQHSIIMKDYKKLFLVFDVGIGDMSPVKADTLLVHIRDYISEQLDDTVKFFVFPNRDSNKIEVKTLMTQKISEKQLKKLIDTTEQWYLEIKRLNDEKQ